MIFRRSRGDTTVRDAAPATAPARSSTIEGSREFSDESGREDPYSLGARDDSPKKALAGGKGKSGWS